MPFKKPILALTLFAALMITGAAVAEVYLTKEKALAQVLPKSRKITEEKHTLTAQQAKDIGKAMNGKLKEKSATFYVGRTDDKIDGYAVIQNEIGKEMPITFMVGITPDGKISEVLVMEFRESRGSEVRHKRFLNQFDKKGLKNPISLNKDIKNITGATLSCRAAIVAVRKSLAEWEVLYGRK